MNITRDPLYGCELAHGRRDRDGYVLVGSDRAHLVAWRSANGPILDGREVDHLCRRRACVALHHLELVTRSENEMRKQWRYRARRAKCARGHALSENRQVTPEGGIVCSACNKAASLGSHAPRLKPIDNICGTAAPVSETGQSDCQSRWAGEFPPDLAPPGYTPR